MRAMAGFTRMRQVCNKQELRKVGIDSPVTYLCITIYSFSENCSK